jgi:small conductance mechanosensitive channel
MDLELVERTVDVVIGYVPHVVGGIVILIVGWIIAGIAARWARAGLTRVGRVDPTLRNFLVSLLRYAILMFTGLAMLNAFGVQTASLIALFGAAGLAIGLALQGTLSNVAAGTMLLLLRPFKVGDSIDAGGTTAGTVIELGLFTTELATADNVQVIVPNTALWGATLRNYSYHPTRRQDLTLRIGYGDDLELALAALRQVLAEEPRVHAEPVPEVLVGALADSSVNLIARFWCAAADYGPLAFDLTKRFKQTCDARGISIPLPQRDVRIRRPPAA